MKIAFYKKEKGTWLDFAVDAMSGFGGYSHCELVFDGNAKDYDYSKSYCFSISGRDNCARFKTINLKSGHWDLFEITDKLINEDRVISDSAKYLGAKYDYIGIFFNWVIPTGWASKTKFWCSELDSFLLFGSQNSKISPNTLSKHYKLKKL